MKKFIASWLLLAAGSVAAHGTLVQDFLMQSQTQAQYEQLTATQREAFEALMHKLEMLNQDAKTTFESIKQENPEGVAALSELLKEMCAGDVNLDVQLSLTGKSVESVTE